MSKKNYTDQKFINEVVVTLFSAGKKKFTTSDVRQLFLQNPKINELYKGVSWAQAGRYPNRGPAWDITTFSDRVVRNMKQVCKRTKAINYNPISNGTYTLRYGGGRCNQSFKIPKRKNFFELA